MFIGNIPEVGYEVELNKWYVWVRLCKCPPNQIGVFRPYLEIGIVKWLDRGELHKFRGRAEKKIGGWKYWSSPIGINFSISTYGVLGGSKGKR